MEFIKRLLQLILGAFLTSAGLSHLGSNRQAFQAQVPTWLPIDADFVVIASGLVEIALGITLITTVFIFTKYRKVIGLATAIFFVLIFPGNINQYVNGIDAFGLDTDQKRLTRLFFQPLLVLWALWASDGVKYLAKFRKKAS
ncbi:MAG: hypothetical protein O3C50_01315 [Actinomycetota bacterium]|nr:hypothetical protein [Actinomycetota bacterium]MDA2997410.1 hypothetical protein [Actinomycetota bacterium]MDA3036160.1 hypothetical protein [Actinomycetota bacterium]